MESKENTWKKILISCAIFGAIYIFANIVAQMVGKDDISMYTLVRGYILDGLLIVSFVPVVRKSRIPISSDFALWDVVYGILGTVCLQIVVSEFFLLLKIGSSEGDGFWERYGEPGWKLFVACAILGPFAEELVFRGTIFVLLQKKIPVAFAAVVSSGAFSILHQGIENQIISFGVGVILCMVLNSKKNLLLPILIHIGNNVLVYYINLPGDEVDKSTVSFGVFDFALMLICAIALYLIFKKFTKVK